MEECILKTRYFRRKQNSDAVEWIEMSGAEYLDFVRDPENKDRFFLNMKNVVLECSKEEYLQSRTEKRRSDYLAESKKGWTIISLFAQQTKSLPARKSFRTRMPMWKKTSYIPLPCSAFVK